MVGANQIKKARARIEKETEKLEKYANISLDSVSRLASTAQKVQQTIIKLVAAAKTLESGSRMVIKYSNLSGY